MVYVAMTTHLQRLKLAYSKQPRTDVSAGLHRCHIANNAMTFEQPCYKRTPNWQLGKSSKSFVDYLRPPTYSSDNFFVA